jgi:hypothetical protein
MWDLRKDKGKCGKAHDGIHFASSNSRARTLKYHSQSLFFHSADHELQPTC